MAAINKEEFSTFLNEEITELATCENKRGNVGFTQKKMNESFQVPKENQKPTTYFSLSWVVHLKVF